MKETYVETSHITYGCGCQHEIGRDVSGMWESTGNDKNCKKHSK